MEFALVLPILTLFLFGIVQFGLAYDKQQSINSAAREGARLGSLPTSSLASIATRAVEAYDASAAPGTDPTVIVRNALGAELGRRNPNGSYSVNSTNPAIMPCGLTTPSQFISVTVSTPFDITIPFYGVQPITIDAEAQFRCE